MLVGVQLNWHSYNDGEDMYWHKIPQCKMALYYQETLKMYLFGSVILLIGIYLSRIETLDWDLCIKMFITMFIYKSGKREKQS